VYTLENKNKLPLHIQLYEAIKKEILSELKVGDKLPSIRKIASEHNISKTTVESAYSQLYAEGYIESYPKRGYFVSDFNFNHIHSHKTIKSFSIPKVQTYIYDFFPAQLSHDSFPLKLWKRLYTKSINETLDFGAYHDGQGEYGLREQISKYLIKSRGVHCDASQVVICSGFSDAMELLAKLLKEDYTHFAIENPGYHVARRCFEAYGYKIDKIHVDKQGLNIDALKASKAKLVYITPSHQYPTGVTMPIPNRLQLLAHMKEIQGIIIEDDYDSELNYINRPIPSLQGLDVDQRVVYMGTFAKSLSPALRLSYMVLPKHLLPRYHASYDAHFPRVSLMTQKTLEAFMQEGHWERHVRKIRTLNKKKHNLMLKCFKETLADTYEILSQGGGLAILIMPTVPLDLNKLIQEAEKKQIKLYLAKERSGGEFEALRMGFGRFSEASLVEAVTAFGEVWHQLI
jgi:GntR family transcriptional regulator/MocR family aminotransferase